MIFSSATVSMIFFGRKQEFNADDPVSVISACRQNNPKAQRALIKLFYGYVKSIALRYAGSSMPADEIINDSFLKVFNNLSKYDDSKPFKAWLRVITINTATDYYRKNKKDQMVDEPMNTSTPDCSEDQISRLSAEEILALIQQLSPAYRMVFSLYVIDGYSHKEIAEILGIKEGTSKSNLQDARHKLQSLIIKNTQTQMTAYELKNLHGNEK